MREDKSKTKPSNQIENLKLTLELLTDDLDKTKMCLDNLKRLVFTPLDLEVRRNSLNFIDNLYVLLKRTEDNYKRLNSRIDNFSEATKELEQAVSESYKNINERFNFWLHDLANNKSEHLGFLELTDVIKSNELTYSYFLNRLVNINSYILIGKPISDLSNNCFTCSKYVKNSGKLSNPLKKIWYKLFKKPNKLVYYLFNIPRKDKMHGTFKAKDSLELKEYRPFNYDVPEQLLKILYDFINMYGIDRKNCVNLITDNRVFVLFMSEQPFIMKNSQVELTINIADKNNRKISKTIVFN